MYINCLNLFLANDTELFQEEYESFIEKYFNHSDVSSR